MATRSTIAIEQTDGTVRQVYCHWDGYLEHVGQVLLDNYQTPGVVGELISFGDISSLEERIVETCFYGRDRGETECGFVQFDSFESYKANHQYEEFEYIFRTDGNWYVSQYESEYTLLEEELDQVRG